MQSGMKRAVTSQFTSKSRKRAAVLAVTGAAVAAGVVLAGPAGASPLAPPAASAVTGTEHFQIMTTSPTATTAGTIAWGVWTAAGVDHENMSSAKTSTDLFAFAGGTFKVTHTTTSQTGGLNAKTCLYMVNLAGTYKLGGGTGKFRGASGHGTFTGSILGVFPKTKSGACSPTANPTVFQQVINASGPYTQ